MRRKGTIAATAVATALAVGALGVSQAAAAYPVGQNGRIVFQSLRLMSNFDIWIMGNDGSSPTNLTSDSPADASASFSPDGNKIIWHKPDPGPGGDSDIFTMNSDGANKVNLTSGSPVADVAPFALPDNKNPDLDRASSSIGGQRIVFARDVDPAPATSFDIFVANANATGVTGAVNITNRPGDEVPHDVSPDGKRIVLTANEGGDVDVFTMNTDGTGLTNLTPARTGFDADPEFTPDGKRVAFATDVDPTAGSNLDVALISSTDGSGFTDITPRPDDQRAPSPSPDGKKIAYEETLNIWIAGIDGSSPVDITPPPAMSSSDAHSPRWESIYTCGKRRATIVGTDAADVLRGTKGPDVIVGNGANDKLIGRGGRDRICGGRGKDKISGGGANDQLFGEAGKDQLVGGTGSDLIKGGKGRDSERQ